MSARVTSYIIFFIIRPSIAIDTITERSIGLHILISRKGVAALFAILNFTRDMRTVG